MSIEKLEYFYIVAKYRSLTKAAKELFVGISSLSLAIKSLENELGFDLFIRQGKNLELSAAGKRILPYVKNILNTVQKIYFPLLDHCTQSSFKIKIGVSNPFLQSVISEQDRNKQEYNFSFVPSTSLDIFAKLRDKEVSLGITSSKIDDLQFERTMLFQTKVILATSCPFLLDSFTVETQQELETIPFLILKDHLGHEALTKTVSNFLEIKPTFVYYHGSLGVHQWLCANKGVLVLHEIEKKLLNDETIRFLPMPNQLIITYYLYQNKKDPFTFNVNGAKKYLKSVYDKKWNSHRQNKKVLLGNETMPSFVNQR